MALTTLHRNGTNKLIIMPKNEFRNEMLLAGLKAFCDKNPFNDKQLNLREYSVAHYDSFELKDLNLPYTFVLIFTNLYKSEKIQLNNSTVFVLPSISEIALDTDRAQKILARAIELSNIHN